jgi:hypothetical protein
VARPGLEPGTPRFSVRRTRFPNGPEIPAHKPVSADAARVCIAAGSTVSIGGEQVRDLGPCHGFGEIALQCDGVRTSTVSSRTPVTL